MTTNEFVFGVLPYVAAGLAVFVTFFRWKLHPFSVSSLSSQLLESRKLYWGSVPFHWGLSSILVFHLFALALPQGVRWWDGVPVRLYMLEITGLALGLWAAVGIGLLIWRRLTTPRIRAVTQTMDLVVLGIVAVQILTGIWIAVGFRWGSFWGTSVMVPYVRSLFSFHPQPEFIDPLPFALKAHVFGFIAFLAVFPFTRLVHIITLPLGYSYRPWQRVVRMRRDPAVYDESLKELQNRV